MQIELVMATVKEATKGANINLSWHRVCKTKKAVTDTISKSVETVGRVGINYDNQKVVKEKRENGELPEQSQAIWYGKGEFVIFPYLIRHTVTEQRYLRLYNGTGNVIPKVQYFRNGVPCTFESVETELLASEKRKEKGDCFCCKIEDMTSIAWVKSSENVEEKKENTAPVPF